MRLAGFGVAIALRFTPSTSIPSGGRITLSFPTGFFAPQNSPLIAPGNSSVLRLNATCSSIGASALVLTTAGNATGTAAFLATITGIVMGTAQLSSPYGISVKTSADVISSIGVPSGAIFRLDAPSITLSSVVANASNVTMSVVLLPSMSLPSDSKLIVTLSGSPSCAAGTSASFTSPAGAAGTVSILNSVLTVALYGTFSANTAIAFSFGGVQNPMNPQSALTNVSAAVVDNVAIPQILSLLGSFPAIVNGYMGQNAPTIELSAVVMGFTGASMTVRFTPSAPLPSDSIVVITLAGSPSCANGTPLTFTSPAAAIGVARIVSNVLYASFLAGVFAANSLISFSFGTVSVPALPQDVKSNVAAAVTNSNGVVLGTSVSGIFPAILNGSLGAASPAFSLSSVMAGASGVVMTVAFTPAFSIPSNAKIVVTLTGSSYAKDITDSAAPACSPASLLSFVSPSVGASGTATITGLSASNAFLLTITLTSGEFSANNLVTFTFGSVRNPYFAQAAITNVAVAIFSGAGTILSTTSAGRFPAILSLFSSAPAVSVNNSAAGATNVKYFVTFTLTSSIPSDSSLIVTLTGYTVPVSRPMNFSSPVSGASGTATIMPPSPSSSVFNSVLRAVFSSGVFSSGLVVSFSFESVTNPAIPWAVSTALPAAVLNSAGDILGATASASFPMIRVPSVFAPNAVYLGFTTAFRYDCCKAFSVAVTPNVPIQSGGFIAFTVTGVTYGWWPCEVSMTCAPSVMCTLNTCSSPVWTLTLNTAIIANTPLVWSWTYGSLNDIGVYFTSTYPALTTLYSYIKSTSTGAIAASSSSGYRMAIVSSNPYFSSASFSLSNIFLGSQATLTVSFTPSAAMPPNANIMVTLFGFSSCPRETPLVFTAPAAGAAGYASIVNDVLTITFTSGSFVASSQISFRILNFGNPSTLNPSTSVSVGMVVEGSRQPARSVSFPTLSNIFGVNRPAITLSSVVMGSVGVTLTVLLTPTASLPSNHTIVLTLTGIQSCNPNAAIVFAVPGTGTGFANCMPGNILVVNVTKNETSGLFTALQSNQFSIMNVTNFFGVMSASASIKAALINSSGVILGTSATGTFPAIVNGTMAASPSISLSSVMAGHSGVKMSLAFTPAAALPSGAKLIVTLSGSPSCAAGTSASFASPAGAAGTVSILNSVLTVALYGTFSANTAIAFSFGGVQNPMNPQSALTNVSAVVVNSAGVIVASSISGVFSYVLSGGLSVSNSSVVGPATGAILIQSYGIFFSLERSVTAVVSKSACELTRWASSSSFMCKLPSGVGSAASVTVSYFASARASAAAAYTYDGASIRAVNTSSNSLQMQLTGSSFGTYVAVQSVSPICSSEPTLMNAASANSTVCESLGVLTSGVSSSKLVGISFGVTLSRYNRLDDVQVAAITPAGLRIILMNNRCFGCSNSSIYLQFSSASSKPLPITNCVSGVYGIASFSPAEIAALLSPPSVFGSWSLQVSVSGSESTILVSQSSMVFVVATLQFSVGLTAASEFLWVSDSAVKFTAPPGFGRGLNISGKSGDRTMVGSSLLVFSYPDPVLSNASNAAIVARTSSAAVSFVGNYFSLTDASPRSRVASSSCHVTRWLSDTAMQCRQHRPGWTSSQTVSIGGITSSLQNPFSSSLAVVESVPVMTAASTGSVFFRVSGYSFAVMDVSTSVRLMFSSSVQTCWICDSTIVLKTPTLFQQHVPAVVSVGLIPSFYSISLLWNDTTTQLHQATPSTGSIVTVISLQRSNRLSFTQLSAAARYGKTSCEWSRWTSQSSISVKIPAALSSFETSALVVSLGTCCQQAAFVANFPQLVPQLINVRNSSIDVVEIAHEKTSTCKSDDCISVLLSGTGFGTKPPFETFHFAKVGFDNVKSVFCVDVFWSSDSSLSCTYRAVSTETMKNSVQFSIMFLNSMAQQVSSMTTQNPYFIPIQYPIQDVVSYLILTGPLVNRPTSNQWSGSALSRDYYASGQLIQLSIVFVNNNSQPYVTASGYMEVVALVSFVQFIPLNTSLPNASVCASLDLPSYVRIPPASASQVFNFAIALCSKAEAPIFGRLVFTFELKNVPGFSNASIQSSSAFDLHHVASTQLLVLSDPLNVVAMESGIPAVTFSVTFLPSVVACSELMFVYSASLTCNNSVLQSTNATVSKDCEFTPQFLGTVPFISEDCYISASLPFLNRSVVRSRAFSSTFGSEVSVLIVGSVPQQLEGGGLIASVNMSQGYCLIAQLIDKNGFLVQKAGVIGTLAASVDGHPYKLIGITTAVTDSNGELYWCNAKTSNLSFNIVLRIQFVAFVFKLPGTYNVSVSGPVSSVTLQVPPPMNSTILPGAPPPPVTLTLVDNGGNSIQTTPSTFVRVQVFSRKTLSRTRRLLANLDDYAVESESTCPGGGAQYVQLASASNFTVNVSGTLCTAGDSIVVYDVVNIVNGSINVVLGGIFSFDIFVISGPAVVFSLRNAASSTLPSYTQAVNATAVVFQDAGRNTVFGNDTVTVSVVFAEAYEVLSNGSNAAVFVSNVTDIQLVRLLIPSLYRLSGKYDVFLPAFVACVNIGRNYSRVRLTFSASAASLQYLKTSNAFVDVHPKCQSGSKVTALSSDVYQCSACPISMVSGIFDSNDCKCVCLSAVREFVIVLCRYVFLLSLILQFLWAGSHRKCCCNGLRHVCG
jgi:hypothetical protein